MLDPVKSKLDRANGFLCRLLLLPHSAGPSTTGTSRISAPLLAVRLPYSWFPVSPPDVRHQAEASSFQLLMKI
jgi:hypothetical protein